ncbi:leucine-rich repeat protein [Heliobacterium gestii]|uniref:Leucine-rich repeat protein n=1 Tax=Heliomicrobium gestii TaxID=2699 RepID=A0A845LEE7_HELGE|nr:leucine-rich repeat domain-containing protein [Heliomicrobium gestii]MBM7866390.1 hypothetical protein [Heliomicrobium gestii]MZP42825.1 leucine-rich repeat protein [Heliomicrobium gestii]
MKKRWFKSAAVLVAFLFMFQLFPFVSQAGSSEFFYTVSDNQVTIDGCITNGAVTIPDTIDGYPVTKIGNDAFSYKSTITSVVIPNTVTTIGSRAFSDCANLASVTMGSGVTTIGGFAFYNCSKVTSFTLPDSVTTIGEQAFNRCSALTGITIPKNVTTIGADAFGGYPTNMQAFYVDDQNATYAGVDGVLYDKMKTALLLCPRAKTGQFTVPNGVRTISDKAFYSCYGLTGISLPDTVTTIGNSAFQDCSGVTTLNIPSGVTAIGRYAFSNCGISSATIPYGITSINEAAFQSCPSLTSLTIPNGVSDIGNSAFSYCSGLTTITIPGSVYQIGDNAFYNCTSLTEARFLGSAPTMSDNVFQNCSPDFRIRYIQGGSTLDHIKLNITQSLLAVGDTYPTVVSAIYDDRSLSLLPDCAVQFSSASPSIASISDDGLIEAVAPGTTVIQAVYDSNQASATVTVTADDLRSYGYHIYPERIRFEPGSATIPVKIEKKDDAGPATILYSEIVNGYPQGVSTAPGGDQRYQESKATFDFEPQSQYTANVLIWDSLESMKPLAKPRRIVYP